MARRKGGARRSGQVNVPLAVEDEDVLDALTYLEHASRAELLAPVVARFLRKETGRPDVTQAIDARRLGERDEKKVTPIDTARERRGNVER